MAPMPPDVAERVVSLFTAGESVNHIVFLLNYEHCIDQVSAAIRDRLRQAVAPAADDCSCRFSGDQADASDCVRHGNSVAPAAAVECGWHRPGVMDGGVRLCRSCAVPITECGCSNFGRTPKARCELCHGSGWVAKGAA